MQPSVTNSQSVSLFVSRIGLLVNCKRKGPVDGPDLEGLGKRSRPGLGSRWGLWGPEPGRDFPSHRKNTDFLKGTELTWETHARLKQHSRATLL